MTAVWGLAESWEGEGECSWCFGGGSASLQDIDSFDALWLVLQLAANTLLAANFTETFTETFTVSELSSIFAEATKDI